MIDNITTGVNNAEASVVIRGTVPNKSFGNVENWRAFIETEPSRKVIPPQTRIAVFGHFEVKTKNSIMVLRQDGISIEVDLGKEDLRDIIIKLARIQRFNHPEEERWGFSV